MRSKLRQGSLGFWEVAVLIFIPALVALVGGVLLAAHSVKRNVKRAEMEQLRDLKVQSWLVAGSLLEEVESIRTHAVAVQQAADVQVAMHTLKSFPEILYWAEIEKNNQGAYFIRRSLKKPGWQDGVPSTMGGLVTIPSPTGSITGVIAGVIDDEYLTHALKQVEVSGSKTSSLAILRLKQEPNRPNEWLALVFPQLLVVVDPVQVFTLFQHWGSPTEAGGTRGYLVGSDGYVLTHSLSAYSGANFSQTPMFQGPLRAILSGQASSVEGTFRAMDHTEVLASARRLGPLPLGVVTEKVKENGSQESLLGSFLEIRAYLLDASGVVFVFFALVALWVAASSWAVLLRLQNTLSALSSVRPSGLSLQPTVAAELPTRIHQERPVQAQFGEPVISQELKVSADRSRILQDRRIALARFESELESLAASGDTQLQRRGLQRMASFIHEASGSPALFFQFHPVTRNAVLVAYAGANSADIPRSANDGLSFPVIGALEASLLNSGKNGEILSLTNYAPLVNVMEKKWRVPAFEAWAVQGVNKKQFLGVLVVLTRARECYAGFDETVARVIRSAGTFYENSQI